MNFQTKLMREQGQGEGDRVPRIGERSESFNERLVAQLGSGSGGQIAEVGGDFFVFWRCLGGKICDIFRLSFGYFGVS